MQGAKTREQSILFGAYIQFQSIKKGHIYKRILPSTNLYTTILP